MAVATLSTTRVLRKPRRADPRALVGVFLTVAALAGSVAFWVNTTDTRPVLMATHDLPAGATLRSSDLAVTYVRVEDGVLRVALPAEQLDATVGRRVAEPVHADQLLVQAQLADQPGLAPGHVAMTIPARPESAVGGRLRPGDWVEVFVTVLDKVRGEAHAHPVVARVQVFEVGRDSSLTPSSTSTDAAESTRGAIANVTLAVTEDQARELAEARRLGDLDVVLLPVPDSSAE